jgi:hypothetical protein
MDTCGGGGHHTRLMTSEDDELAGDAPLLSMGEGFDASMGEGYADLGETATAPSNATMGDADADGTAATDERSRTAMKKLRIVILGVGTARQKRLLE